MKKGNKKIKWLPVTSDIFDVLRMLALKTGQGLEVCCGESSEPECSCKLVSVNSNYSCHGFTKIVVNFENVHHLSKKQLRSIYV